MTRWIGETFNIEGDFKDHSGLSDKNRISADDMTKLLLAVGADGDLRPIMSDLAFTIFAADVERRERGKASGDEIPAGSIEWNRRAKRLQQVLLQRWGLIYRDGAPSEDAVNSPGSLFPETGPVPAVGPTD